MAVLGFGFSFLVWANLAGNTDLHVARDNERLVLETIDFLNQRVS